MSEEKHYLSNGSDAAAQTPGAALEFGRTHGAKMVDLKFTDLLGTWQHVSLPLSAIDEADFEEGLGFDGSSIRGWKGIAESDMLLVPDADTAFIDPFMEEPTLSLLCGIVDPISREAYDRDPRLIAKRAEAYLALDRDRRHRLLRPRGRVLRLRRRLLRDQREPRLLRGRLGRGLLELGHARARVHDPREARLLPGRRRTTRSTTCAPRWC